MSPRVSVCPFCSADIRYARTHRCGDAWTYASRFVNEQLAEVALRHDLILTGNCFWVEQPNGRKLRVDPERVEHRGDRWYCVYHNKVREVKHMALQPDVLAELAAAHVVPPPTVEKVNAALDRADREVRDLRRQVQDARVLMDEARQKLEDHKRDAARWRWMARHLTQLVITTDMEFFSDDNDTVEVTKIEFNSAFHPSDVETVNAAIDRLMEVVK